MIVIHHEQDEGDQDDPAQHGRRDRPFVHRDLEDLEDRVADRGVGEDQQQFHQAVSRPCAACSSRARRSSRRLQPRLRVPGRRAGSPLTEAPAAIGAVGHRPDPQERPQRMQREQADPAGGMDRILVGMAAMLCDLVRNVVNCDDRVEDRDQHKEHQAQSKVVEKHRDCSRAEPRRHRRTRTVRAPSFPVKEHLSAGRAAAPSRPQ